VLEASVTANSGTVQVSCERAGPDDPFIDSVIITAIEVGSLTSS
jgi:hypothetical protein